MKREAKFATTLRHWLRAHPLYTCAMEAKYTTTDSIPFSDVSEAQLDWARAIENDQGVFIRTVAVAEGMPDYIYLRDVPAFIVIGFPGFFVLIRVNVFINEKERSKRKSLTAARAREICTVAVDLKK